jgi:hypothetical protein
LTPRRAACSRSGVQKLLAPGVLGLLAAGCFTTSGASSQAEPMVRIQASTDFDCPQSEIRIEKNWGGRFEAKGCGQHAVYNTGCDDGVHCIVQPEGKAVPWRDRPEPAPGNNP